VAHHPVPLQTGAGGADSAGTLSPLLCADESQLWLKVAVWCLPIEYIVFVISNVQILEYALPVHLHGNHYMYSFPAARTVTERKPIDVRTV